MQDTGGWTWAAKIFNNRKVRKVCLVLMAKIINALQVLAKNFMFLPHIFLT